MKFIAIMAVVFATTLIALKIISIIKYKTSKKERGKSGEKRVAHYLNFLDKNEYKILNNVILKLDNGNTSQIDHIVFSRTGIYVIETKNYVGTIKNLNGKQWVQVNRCSNPFYSPILQNRGHIYAIRSLLNIRQKNIFHSIIAFPDKTGVCIKSDEASVIHMNDICEEIEKHSLHIFDYNEVEEMYNKVKKNNIANVYTEKKHVQKVAVQYS